MATEPLITFDTQFGSNATTFENMAPTLKSSQQAPSVAIPIQDGREIEKHQNGLGIGVEGDPSYTLDQTGSQSVAYAPHESGNAGLVIRKLTPIECERLQGWPDNHTLFRADGKANSDTTRHRMCGNGVAAPVARWIAEQINKAEADELSTFSE